MHQPALGAPRIALDAFGTDRSPGPELEAAAQAARRGVTVVLVGPKAALPAALEGRVRGATGSIEIHDAADIITMDDVPGQALRRKPGASMPVCFDLVRSGVADAVVSAGNSGAMLGCGLLKYGRVAGVDRPAFLATMPTHEGVVCILDVGANVECRPHHLVQFAVMGAVYASLYHGKSSPRVAILANGTEGHKGTEITRDADRVLARSESSDFSYAGYVEGHQLFEGGVDVVVTDGFTGNVALKVAEGAAGLVGARFRRVTKERLLDRIAAGALRRSITAIARVLDPSSYGGAPLLGVDGVAVTAHGGSTSRALRHAMEVAARLVDRALIASLEAAIARHRPLWESGPLP